MTPGGGEPTASLGPFRPEPDELDRRVRSLRAERMRPSPQAVHRPLWTPILSGEPATPNLLLDQLIDVLATGLYDPHDWRPPA